ncbi:DUF1573 domain-containing protein [Aureispira sp. CCB-QB1]|uniref:DUF1573 domain-containing protein n=1 Tax=Aureispira sp. CCB-QB1 TaxID=1313421 RepID=UPI000695B993|nr:DUF1573 domain-containing protein [Aureispira sp. CCB-QB1]
MKLLLLCSLLFSFQYTLAQNIELAEMAINDEGYTLLDFGILKAKKITKRTLILINTGDQDLVISKLEEGCHCTTIKIKKKILKPNEQTKICLKWRPIDDSEFNSSVMIHSNAKNYPQLWIQMEGNVEQD